MQLYAYGWLADKFEEIPNEFKRYCKLDSIVKLCSLCKLKVHQIHKGMELDDTEYCFLFLEQSLSAIYVLRYRLIYRLTHIWQQ